MEEIRRQNTYVSKILGFSEDRSFVFLSIQLELDQNHWEERVFPIDLFNESQLIINKYFFIYEVFKENQMLLIISEMTKQELRLFNKVLKTLIPPLPYYGEIIEA